jgi:PKD repeat protein
MKIYFKSLNWLKFGLVLFAIASMFYACSPDAVNAGLGTKPKADFTAIVGADGHSVLLVNKSNISSMPYWAAPDLNLSYSVLKGDSVKLNYVFPGTYTIKLLVAGAGGLDSITKTVTTTKADPTACSSTNPLGFIASCTQRSWTMNPAPGAFKCGQFAGGGEWWSSGAQEVLDRSCAFNDTYTFKFNAAGDFVFDDKGDFFSDGYIGINPTTTCQTVNQYTTAQKPWGSGNFKFTVLPGAGVKGLGQLVVVGVGAHIGIPKAINGNETPNGATATSVTYDIWSMQHVTDPKGDYDLLMLTLHYGNWSATEGWWTFTLRSNSVQ